MTQDEGRVLTVVGQATVLATWYLLERSPYMVYGDVILPNGRLRKMTEVEIPMSTR